MAGEDFGSGVGRSKKEAEQKAAESAWRAIKEKYADRLPAGA